jgi:hypothetical protein
LLLGAFNDEAVRFMCISFFKGFYLPGTFPILPNPSLLEKLNSEKVQPALTACQGRRGWRS